MTAINKQGAVHGGKSQRQELKDQIPVEQCDEWSTGLRKVMRHHILMSQGP
jgi:hypothetical protein